MKSIFCPNRAAGLLLDGQYATLHIVGGDEPLSDLADYLFHLLQGFVPNPMGTRESSRNPVRFAGLERLPCINTFAKMGVRQDG